MEANHLKEKLKSRIWFHLQFQSGEHHNIPMSLKHLPIWLGLEARKAESLWLLELAFYLFIYLFIEFQLFL